MHADGETVRRKLKGDRQRANALAGASDQYGSHDGVPWLKSVVNSSSLWLEGVHAARGEGDIIRHEWRTRSCQSVHPASDVRWLVSVQPAAKQPCGAYHHARPAPCPAGYAAALFAGDTRPDADGLRHQLQRKPKPGRLAVRVQEQSQNAPIVHAYAANGAVIGDASRLKQQHRRVVRKITPGGK